MKLDYLSAITAGTRLTDLTPAQVTELQTGLTQLGYPVNGIDGVAGPGTLGAWAAFKSATGSGDPGSIGPGSVQTLQQQLDAPPAANPAGVPPAAVKIVENYEGLRLNAYDDGTGVWTIGYGTIRYPTGQPVRPGETISQTEAERYLTNDISAYAKQLAGSIPNWAAMNGNQRAALICFAYNLGPGFYGSSGFETISAALRERRWSDVPAALVLYSMPGTNVHAGLLARRHAEGLLWQSKGPYAA